MVESPFGFQRLKNGIDRSGGRAQLAPVRPESIGLHPELGEVCVDGDFVGGIGKNRWQEELGRNEFFTHSEQWHYRRRPRQQMRVRALPSGKTIAGLPAGTSGRREVGHFHCLGSNSSLVPIVRRRNLGGGSFRETTAIVAALLSGHASALVLGTGEIGIRYCLGNRREPVARNINDIGCGNQIAGDQDPYSECCGRLDHTFFHEKGS